MKKEKKNQNPKNQKVRRKKRHWGLWISSFLLGVLLLVYFGIATYFQTHFLPNTFINGTDFSKQTKEEVAALLQGQSQTYQLEVIGKEGKTVGILTAPEIELVIVDIESGIEALFEQQNEFQWILAYQRVQDFKLENGITFQYEKAEKIVESWEALDESKSKVPENAYLSEYLSEKKGYEIIPETEGTLLDKEKVKEVVLKAIEARESSVNLEENQCYIEADIKSDNPALINKMETLNKWTGTSITYDWNGATIVLDGDTIHEWIIIDGDNLSINEEAVAEFVATNAKENDTYGKKRKFTTALGEQLTLPSGAFGWKTNRSEETKALLERIQAGSVEETEPVYSSKGAKKGKNDIGSSYVECDLSNQHLYLYQNGNLILESDFVSGKMTSSNTATPPGVFGLTYKTTNAVLKGDDYETPVNYWMPFNGNIGMHDATWRSTFGGDIFQTRGSHGCINLPLENAKTIYSYVSTGFPVICYYY